MKENCLFPEAIDLMRTRHRLEDLFRLYGLNERQESKEIIEELFRIELEMYKIDKTYNLAPLSS